MILVFDQWLLQVTPLMISHFLKIVLMSYVKTDSLMRLLEGFLNHNVERFFLSGKKTDFLRVPLLEQLRKTCRSGGLDLWGVAFGFKSSNQSHFQGGSLNYLFNPEKKLNIFKKQQTFLWFSLFASQKWA